MHDKLFEAALGIKTPWAVSAVNFDEAAKVLTVHILHIDFTPGARFAVPGHEGLHPVHDTVIKRYRHLNFFRGRSCPTARCAWLLSDRTQACPPVSALTAFALSMSTNLGGLTPVIDQVA